MLYNARTVYIFIHDITFNSLWKDVDVMNRVLESPETILALHMLCYNLPQKLNIRWWFYDRINISNDTTDLLTARCLVVDLLYLDCTVFLSVDINFINPLWTPIMSVSLSSVVRSAILNYKGREATLPTHLTLHLLFIKLLHFIL